MCEAGSWKGCAVLGVTEVVAQACLPATLTAEHPLLLDSCTGIRTRRDLGDQGEVLELLELLHGVSPRAPPQPARPGRIPLARGTGKGQKGADAQRLSDTKQYYTTAEAQTGWLEGQCRVGKQRWPPPPPPPPQVLREQTDAVYLLTR